MYLHSFITTIVNKCPTISWSQISQKPTYVCSYFVEPMDGLCEISKYSIHANKIIFITTQFSEMENKHVFAVFDEIIKI